MLYYKNATDMVTCLLGIYRLFFFIFRGYLQRCLNERKGPNRLGVTLRGALVGLTRGGHDSNIESNVDRNIAFETTSSSHRDRLGVTLRGALVGLTRGGHDANIESNVNRIITYETTPSSHRDRASPGEQGRAPLHWRRLRSDPTSTASIN